jgi:hypothetical protein
VPADLLRGGVVDDDLQVRPLVEVNPGPQTGDGVRAAQPVPIDGHGDRLAGDDVVDARRGRRDTRQQGDDQHYLQFGQIIVTA